jgi:hypothetical protein
MRFQRDYILRMIEMMGELFRRIGEMLDDYEKNRELDKISKEYCGMSLDAALALAPSTLIDLLAPQSRFILCELIYIKARTVQLPQEETAQLYTHAVKVLVSLWDDSLICELRSLRLAEMLDCRDLSLTAEDHLSAARFFASAEVLDKAEDEIFNAVDIADDTRAICLEGIALLTRLAKLSDDKLILGNLPREELETAITDLSDL